ncbi:hypothetical protein KM043_003604 [Ampulex compressa]|nr:hypothetical protein KM043_003604 [Ampulex compressa]
MSARQWPVRRTRRALGGSKPTSRATKGAKGRASPWRISRDAESSPGRCRLATQPASTAPGRSKHVIPGQVLPPVIARYLGISRTIVRVEEGSLLNRYNDGSVDCLRGKVVAALDDDEALGPTESLLEQGAPRVQAKGARVKSRPGKMTNDLGFHRRRTEEQVRKYKGQRHSWEGGAGLPGLRTSPGQTVRTISGGI